MKRRVIDTSALMAIFLTEPGQERAAQLSQRAALSSVNFSETFAKCMERSVPLELAHSYIRDANIEIVHFDAQQARVAAELFAVTRKGVLSLGDRACIATATRRNATVVTADRIWADLDLPCPVELIR